MKNTLKNKEEIDKIFKSGKSITGGVIRAKFLDSDKTEFLFAVSSSKFKRAVDRNRIKRLMKESIKVLPIKGKSIAVMIIGAFFINSFGISGVIPIKGIAVPFLSYGGSSIIASCLVS